MKAEIKYFHSPDIDNLESYKPEEKDNFCFLLQIMAGPEQVDGEESFDVIVCTPKWLMNNHNENEIIIGRHHLIVFKYDWMNIKSTIDNYIQNSIGNDWKECAIQLSRLGRWEFEDYKEQ
jgi:hypothetical protein